MRRRSEGGPISLAVRALLELPDTIVEEILRLVDTKTLSRYLVHKPPPRNFGGTYAVRYLPWAGTQRMVNRQALRARLPWTYEIQ